MISHKSGTPRWFTLLAVVLVLPLFQLPLLLSRCPDSSPVRTILFIYPFYAVAAAYLAWQCYPQRKALAWILLILLILSHMATWMLVSTPLT